MGVDHAYTPPRGGGGCQLPDGNRLTTNAATVGDPPPLKWSDLRYVFDIKEDCNGKEAIQA